MSERNHPANGELRLFKGGKEESTFGHFLQYLSGSLLLSKKGHMFHLMVEMASCFIAACSLASATASADSRKGAVIFAVLYLSERPICGAAVGSPMYDQKSL